MKKTGLVFYSLLMLAAMAVLVTSMIAIVGLQAQGSCQKIGYQFRRIFNRGPGKNIYVLLVKQLDGFLAHPTGNHVGYPKLGYPPWIQARNVLGRREGPDVFNSIVFYLNDGKLMAMSEMRAKNPVFEGNGNTFIHTIVGIK
jgi:hypothetical protein